MSLPAPSELIDADLSGLPRVQLPAELHSGEAARSVTSDIRDIVVTLFAATCRSDYKPGSFRNDLDEIAYVARTTPRRLKHRWQAIADLLRLYEGDDGRLWSEVAVPICEDAWRRRLATRAAVRARLRPSSIHHPSSVRRPPPRARENQFESISTPFDSHFAQKTEGFCEPLSQEAKAEGEEESHTPHNESVAARPPASPAGVCEDFLVLWGGWLNRDGRVLAERAYAGARRHVDAETILAAAGSYVEKLIAKYPRLEDRERYGGQLANWLRGARWRDCAAAAERYDCDIEPPSEVDWRSQMLYWTNPNRGGPTRERWQVECWGPMPGDPGCRVPPHLTEIVFREAGEA